MRYIEVLRASPVSKLQPEIDPAGTWSWLGVYARDELIDIGLGSGLSG